MPPHRSSCEQGTAHATPDGTDRRAGLQADSELEMIARFHAECGSVATNCESPPVPEIDLNDDWAPYVYQHNPDGTLKAGGPSLEELRGHFNPTPAQALDMIFHWRLDAMKEEATGLCPPVNTPAPSDRDGLWVDLVCILLAWCNYPLLNWLCLLVPHRHVYVHGTRAPHDNVRAQANVLRA